MLLGMPHIELLDIVKVMCEVVGGQQADRKFDSQTIQANPLPLVAKKTHSRTSNQIMQM